MATVTTNLMIVETFARQMVEHHFNAQRLIQIWHALLVKPPIFTNIIFM